MVTFSRLVIQLIPLLPFASAAAIDKRQTTTTCASGVHLIVARGTGEPPGEGTISSLANQIKARIPGSDDVAVVYPASVFPSYMSSEGAGTRNFTNMIQQYVASCPNTRIVLLGYSQGGQALLDTLCGTSEAGFATTAPLAAQYASHITAAVAYGDPSHVPNQPYNAGTSNRNGDFPRQNNGPCQQYADRLRSYCDTGDPFCDSGFNIAVHGGYFSKYNTDATNFVASRAGA